MKTIEIWKPVEGFDGYEVSDLGRVRKTCDLQPCKTVTHKQGYVRICIKRNDGVFKFMSVHRMVAMAFIPNPEGKATVNHKNGMHTDNRVDNLEWMTQAENNAHAYATGLKNSDHVRVVPDEIVKEIRSCYTPYHKEFGATPLAKRFGLSISQVYRIARGLYYKEGGI